MFQFGILLIYAVVAFGMAVATTQLGRVFNSSAAYLQLAGGAFIIYLGTRLIFTTRQATETENVPTFRSGALLQILNPKYPAVMVAIFSARSDTDNLVTAGVIVTVGAIGLLLYSYVGSLIHRFASDGHYLRLLNIVFGLSLCAVGLWIAFGLAGN